MSSSGDQVLCRRLTEREREGQEITRNKKKPL
jgi:hypothetical protein